MARLWRAFHDATDLGPGRRVTLAPDEAHHVRRVLRLAPGEALAVFDGRGGEWLGTLDASGPEGVVLTLGAARAATVEAPIDVRLFQGRSRPERFELVVQKATEIGVREIVSLECERSDGRAPDDRRLARFRRLAIEACKQCGRRRLPALGRADELPRPPAGVTALWLDAAPARPFAAVPAGAVDAVWLAVGPEGGFTEGERRRARAAGWTPVDLGPRVLRTETAGIVAVALALHRWGDLGADGAGERATAPAGNGES